MRLARRSTLSALAATALLSTVCAGAAQAATPVPKVGTPFPYVGLVRAAGADRYETAAVIAQGSFQPSSGSAVFITSGESAADALTAGPAAASLDAPLLLTRAGDLPAATATELARLKPATVYVVGGTDRVSDTVLSAIGTAAAGATVTRIAGATRYETAVDVAETFFPNPEGVVVTRGDTFPDALSGGAAAASAGVPVMLTEPTSIPAPVAQWMAQHTFASSVVVGSSASVSDQIAATVASRTSDPADATRLAGADRYDTSAAVATALFPQASTVVIATGDDFPDALAAYVQGNTDISAEIVLGGPTSVTPEALTTTC